jgi:hypothetical protein
MDYGMVAALRVSTRHSYNVIGAFAGFTLLSPRSTSSGVDEPVGYLAHVSHKNLIVDAQSPCPRIVREDHADLWRSSTRVKGQ